eukprot:7123069-Prymnesium_polylepis.1
MRLNRQWLFVAPGHRLEHAAFVCEFAPLRHVVVPGQRAARSTKANAASPRARLAKWRHPKPRRKATRRSAARTTPRQSSASPGRSRSTRRTTRCGLAPSPCCRVAAAV